MKDRLPEFNVQCIACGSVWSPQTHSPLWWAAKKRSNHGYLDALGVTGERCGCIPTQRDPHAPYRVFGYDMMQAFDTPYHRFVDAVRAYRDLQGYVDDVFISGVSLKVEEQLRWA